MNKRLILLSSLAAFMFCPRLVASAAVKPNIIFLLTDDLGYSDVSCYGSTKVATPHIDQLATDGFRFTDFHTAASVCSPSRAAFLAGGYPQRTGSYMGVKPNSSAHWFLGLNPDEITIAEQLKAVGYKTFMVGKWHLGLEPEFFPRKQGFDQYYGMPCNFDHSPRFFDNEKEVYAKTPLDQLTELYTDRVTQIIRENSAEPFFLYYAHNYPHKPLVPGKKFAGTSGDGVHGDVMLEIDWGVREMMKALKDAGIADNTIVIFSSDNGAPKGQYTKPFRGTKYVTLEGGHRVPFIFHWPALISQGAVSDVSVHAMDLFPTLSEIAGAPMPTDRVYDGQSLLPLLDGQAINRDQNEPFYYYNCENLQAVRRGDWKLHLPRTKHQVPGWDKDKQFINAKQPVLYNLRTDQSESKDVAEENPEIVGQLQRLAEEMRKELGEHMQPGKGQRPTGSIYPDAPVIGNDNDWKQMPIEIIEGLNEEWEKRHPNERRKQKK